MKINETQKIEAGQRVTDRGLTGTVIEVRRSGWCLVQWDGENFAVRETGQGLRPV